MLTDLKFKTSRNFIYFSTVNGHVYSVDEKFENKLSLIKSFYTHRLVYIEFDDEILFTDQMNNVTKLLTVNETYARTKNLFYSNFYSVQRIQSGYLFGEYDGNLKYLKKSGNKNVLHNMFKFVKKGNCFLILDTSEEIEYIKDPDFSCLIVEICQIDKTIFLFLKCGIIFKFLLNK